MTISLADEKLRRTICKVFAAFPPKSDWDLKLNVYTEALSRIPSGAVEEAADYVIRGKLNGGRFLPSAGELVKLAQELQARKLRAQNGKHKFYWQHNDPSVYNSPEQRAKIVYGFGRLLADLRRGRPIDPDAATKRVFTEE